MSFTTGGLFRHESVKLATLYLELADWSAVRDNVIDNNVLQTRTLGTLKRICYEIISRLKTLNDEELTFFVTGTYQEQGSLLWVAVCRRYAFIADFATEVIRERYITMKIDLSSDDFNAFLNRKTEWHSELDELQPSTRNKLRQVLFKILHEVGLLSTNNKIHPAMLSSKLISLISYGNRNELLYFPMFESELKRMLK